MVLWGESFWGDGNRGFEVLSSNVKNGAIAIEEFQRFLSESVQCESTYSKNLSRLQSQLFKTQYVGTFTPIWNLIRDLFDKISATHLTTVNFYQELLRDVHNYQELYQKKLKTHIQKDNDITRSTDLISQLNNALNTVNKAKEQYHAIALDNERPKRIGNLASNSISQDNNPLGLAQTALNSLTSRQMGRSEKKQRQAEEEYKSTIDRYNAIRNDYEKRFFDACTKFQDFEIDHIEKMLVYSLNYSEILQRNSEQIRIAQNEFNEKLKSLTGNDILDAFVQQKKTGTDPPAILQFEDVDGVKTSMQLTNTNISDSSGGQDDFNLFDQLEPGVPSFQAHFSVPPAPTKSNDNNRARHHHHHHHHHFFHASSPNATGNQPQSPLNNTIIYPLPNTPPTSVNPMISNNLATRTQETHSSNDQIHNPFDVKIRRPKFPGFFGSNRKEKKEKKLEKKPSITSKSHKTPPVQLSRDESNGINSQNSYNEVNDLLGLTGKNEDFIQSSSISNNDMNYQHGQNTNLFSSKISKSSSSSDTSDDDDDNMMLKINVKINPKTEISPDGGDDDDDTKIMNAMRLVDKNLGNFVPSSRGSPHKTLDISKSVSSEQIGIRLLPPPPPPIPSRSATTIPNSTAVDFFDQLNIFPPHGEFDRSPSNITSMNQENLSIPSQWTRESKSTASVSSTDDDTEVANTFPNDDLTSKTIPFPILQVPSPHQSNQQQSPLSSASQSIASMNVSFRNSPTVSNEQGVSPLTIGATDQIPLAIAFQEIIHVMISGNNQENWKSQIVGEMLISFPASMVNLLIDPSRLANTLEFQLKNTDNIENIVIKSSSITQNESNYSFDMPELYNILRNLQEKTPLSRFFNLNVFNYEVKHLDLANIPIEITSQWTRTFDMISVNINYHFNSSVLPESIRINNDTVIFYTIITDGQQIKEASPIAEWSQNEHKLWWKVQYINNGTGSLSATMMTDTIENDNDQQEQPLTTSSIVNAYFVGENALFSSIDLDLTCRGYRISLLKKKILSGKYQSEPDQTEPIHFFQRPTIPPSSTAQ